MAAVKLCNNLATADIAYAQQANARTIMIFKIYEEKKNYMLELLKSRQENITIITTGQQRKPVREIN